MIIETVTTVVQPWYFQFYLLRGPDIVDSWKADQVPSEGYERHLDAIDGFVYVGTTMYGNPTEITVEVHDCEPSKDPEGDYIAEVSLLGEGPIDVFNWEAGEEPVAVVPVPEGSLRLRGTWTGVEAAEAHPDKDRTSDEISPEKIVLQVWPTAPASPSILRSRTWSNKWTPW